MEKDVSIGMSRKTVRVRDGDTADLQGNAGFEFVRVPAVANSHSAQQFCYFS
jgi:hypothetical protein